MMHRMLLALFCPLALFAEDQGAAPELQPSQGSAPPAQAQSPGEPTPAAGIAKPATVEAPAPEPDWQAPWSQHRIVLGLIGSGNAVQYEQTLSRHFSWCSRVFLAKEPSDETHYSTSLTGLDAGLMWHTAGSPRNFFYLSISGGGSLFHSEYDDEYTFHTSWMFGYRRRIFESYTLGLEFGLFGYDPIVYEEKTERREESYGTYVFYYTLGYGF